MIATGAVPTFIVFNEKEALPKIMSKFTNHSSTTLADYPPYSNSSARLDLALSDVMRVDLPRRKLSWTGLSLILTTRSSLSIDGEDLLHTRPVMILYLEYVCLILRDTFTNATTHNLRIRLGGCNL